jgi:hypothetical protein
MRKVFVRFLCASAALAGLAGCGGSDGSGDAAAPSAPSLSVSVPSPATTAPATTAEAPATPQSAEQVTIAVAYANGKLEGGVKTVKVKKGAHIVLDVTSDVDDEVHVHGPDLKRDVTAGTPAHLEFDLPDPGRYEVELEQRGLPIADIQVQP